MKIFVAYGFRTQDQWIPDHVFPLIRAFGSEPVDGEGCFGEIISDEVRTRISTCDALFAFLTQREPDSQVTHAWVQHESGAAWGQGKKVVEIHENTIDDQKGALGDRPYIPFDRQQPLKCIVKLVEALAEWHRAPRSEFLLMQDKLYDDLANDVETALCTLQVVTGNLPPVPSIGQIVRRNKRLYLLAGGLRQGSRFQVKIQSPAGTWTSDQEDAGADAIALSFKPAPPSSDERLIQLLQQAGGRQDNAILQRFDQYRNLVGERG